MHNWGEFLGKSSLDWSVALAYLAQQCLNMIYFGKPITVRKYLLSALPLFDNLVLVAGVAFSAITIDLLFIVKHSLTRATLHKYLYVHR